jgi:chromosome partitioning protein
VAGELKGYFGELLFETSIPRNVRLAEAPSHGQPVILYDPRSRGAESYIRLAKELMERQQKILSVPPPPSASTAVLTGDSADTASAARGV